MIVEKRISFTRLLKITWRELLGIFVVATISVSSLIYFELEHYAINQAIPLVIGTAIAIFLGFRTNSAYDRWWEARGLWGQLLNESRNLIRMFRDFVSGPSDDVDRESREALLRIVCYRQIAAASAMDRQLKGLDLVPLDHWLQPNEWQAFSESRDPSLMLLTEHGRSIRRALDAGWIDSRQSVLLEETLSNMIRYYGGCQRIKNTVFPIHYRFFTRVFIWIFLVLLGFSLPYHETASYTLIPAIFLIGWVFFMVEGIGNYMQDPFENNRNVVPSTALARTIEINLLEMIGESDLPDPIEPVDGALY